MEAAWLAAVSGFTNRGRASQRRSVIFSAGSQSLSEMKKRGHNHEDQDDNSGEQCGDKKAGDYRCHASFSPLYIALPRRMDPNIS